MPEETKKEEQNEQNEQKVEEVKEGVQQEEVSVKAKEAPASNVETTETNQPEQKSNTLKIVIIVGVVLVGLAFLSMSIYAVLNFWNNAKSELSNNLEALDVELDAVVEVDEETELPELVIGTVEENTMWETFDEYWYLYENFGEQFEIKLPAEIGIHCYDPEMDFQIMDSAQVMNFDDFETRSYYIKPDFYYTDDCGAEFADVDYYKSLEKESGVMAWKIVVRDVPTEAHLNSFIVQEFGDKCRMASKKSVGDYTYDVSLKSSSGIESDCFVNAAYAIKYSPELKKAAIWHVGQSMSFMAYEAEAGIDGYDAEVMKSFQFVK